jgi:hypothetical protein
MCNVTATIPVPQIPRLTEYVRPDSKLRVCCIQASGGRGGDNTRWRLIVQMELRGDVRITLSAQFCSWPCYVHTAAMFRSWRLAAGTTKCNSYKTSAHRKRIFVCFQSYKVSYKNASCW